MSTPFSTTNLRLPRFPPELFEFIIDFIGYDEYDRRVEWLHACSLVCSSWEYRARPHLLRVVRLGNIGHVESLHHALLRKRHYRSFIRTLKFRCPRRDHLSTESARDALDVVTTKWISAAISKLPLLLPNLYKLELHRLPSFNLIQSEFPMFCRRFRNIRSLRLGHLTEQTFYQIMHIINELRDLRSIEISDCSWTQFGRVHPLQQRCLSEVYLDLRPDFERTMSAWMIKTDSLSALRSLTWWSYKEPRSQISGILNRCEKTLREATMTIYIPGNHLPQVPFLRNHTLLESFTVDVRQPLSGAMLRFVADVILAMPASIRTVRLTCYENLNSLFNQDDDLFWDSIDRALKRARTQCFEIYSRYPHFVDYTRVDKDLRRAFSRVKIVGIVWCVHRHSETSELLYHRVVPLIPLLSDLVAYDTPD